MRPGLLKRTITTFTKEGQFIFYQQLLDNIKPLSLAIIIDHSSDKNICESLFIN